MTYTNTSSYLDAPTGNAPLWADYIRAKNSAEADAIAEAYFRLMPLIGINADLAIAQACLETARFTSGHWMSTNGAGTREMNPAGIGITGGPNDIITYFGTIDRAVKAHGSHLAAYIYRADNDPYPTLHAEDSEWTDVRSHFNDGIPFIHTLEQPDFNNEGAHRWAASGWSYVTNIISIANLVTGAVIPAPPPPVPPPVIFPPPNPAPTILSNLTHVNVWNAGDWPGRDAMPVRAICLHVMAGTYVGSINWFHNSAAQASANFCISYEGEITMTVDPDAQAPWANGISNAANTALPPGLADLATGWPNANWVTVSIETEGLDPFENGYPRYPAQYDAVVSLMAYLYTKYNIHPSTDTLCRHTYFDTVNRPNCPGPHWDFNTTIGDVLTAMNIPAVVTDPMSTDGVPSADGQYRSFNFLNPPRVVGHGILGYWQQHGVNEGIWRYGYPLSDEEDDTRENGQSLRCQWFERARLEWHPEANGAIMSGLLGYELVTFYNRQRVIANGPLYVATYEGDDRVNGAIDPRIQAYYDAHGGLAQFGYPISPVVKHITDDIELQWFERAALELHPEDANNPVLGRRLGAEFLALRDAQRAAGADLVPSIS